MKEYTFIQLLSQFQVLVNRRYSWQFGRTKGTKRATLTQVIANKLRQLIAFCNSVSRVSWGARPPTPTLKVIISFIDSQNSIQGARFAVYAILTALPTSAFVPDGEG